MKDQASGNPLISELTEILGQGGLLTDPAARLVYSRDASNLSLGRPLAVALPGNEVQLRQLVRICQDHQVPVVCRGTGTGLSGGAVPGQGVLVVGTSRLRGMDPVDSRRRRVRVQPGVLNDEVSRHASDRDLHFAPDPSSQAASSIGGNIAENAGGPHCLRHGVTLQHLRGLAWSDAGGRSLETGRDLSAERGLDLVSLLCGSEGTLGLVTAADLKLVANPQAVSTLLAFFGDLADAARAVVSLLGAGLAPVAMEMVDQAMLLAVEEAFGFGFPTDVEAAMIVEFAGQDHETDEDSERASSLLAEHGAREVRRAADEAERTELWKCRKKAFGAVGRLAPSYVTMDVVVPLGELPGLVWEIQVIKDRHQVEIATTFHAGDGNLHPGVHYDDRDPDQTRRAHAAADEIIRAALVRNGSVTGEHGVGIEKLHAVVWQLDAQTARLQRGIKAIFDPGQILNPGKLHPPSNVEYADLKPAPCDIDFQWENLTVCAPADASLVDIQQAALERGFWIPVGALARGAGFGLGRGDTVGNLVADLFAGPGFCPAGTARDYLLEGWFETGDEQLFHTGAPVFKNVAGYDLTHMLCGSGRVYVKPIAATFQLRPIPESVGCWRFELPAGIRLETEIDRLISLLAGREDSLGGPVLVADAGDESDPIHLVVLVPGRDRPWDLGRVANNLTDLFPAASFGESLILPFQRSEEFLSEKLIPRWALACPNWNVWAEDCRETAALGHWPSGVRRGVWQAAPRLVWSPDEVAEITGWHLDRFCSADGVQPYGPPAAGVPVDFLKSLKVLFDPSGALAVPSWLEESDG